MVIVFDEETRQYCAVSDRQFGVISAAVKAGVAKGAGKAAGNLVGGIGEKPTFLGKFTGKNKKLERDAQRAHEEKMARIAAGTDGRAMADRLLNKHMDNSLERSKLKNERLISKDKNKTNRDINKTENKYRYKSLKAVGKV